MILEFNFENWLSFKDKASFSMMATRERDPFSRLTTDSTLTGRVLPITAIYGYNASGKTNFIQALSYLKNLVTFPNRFVRLQPFAFTNEKKNPTTFFVKFLCANKVYSFTVKTTESQILYEKLSIHTKTSENILYERKDNQLVTLNNQFKSYKTRLEYVMQGTAPTQTFLNNSYTQQVSLFKEVFDWFLLKLVIVRPQSHYDVPDGASYSYEDFNNLLQKLDIQNNEYISKTIAPESLNFNPQFISDLELNLKEGHVRFFANNTIITKKNGKLEFSSVAVKHKNIDGKSYTELDPSTESDGTKRLYELRPVLKDLLSSDLDITFIIDELDRSLHPLLVRQIIKMFNQRCSKDNRTQLIFSCHDSSLLDQELMRRDSYWIITKNPQGISSMQRITNLKQGQRTDKSLRNAYMSGELGVNPYFN